MTIAQQQVKAILGNHFNTIVQLSDIKESLGQSNDKISVVLSAVSGIPVHTVDKLLVAVDIYDKHFKGD
jgi:hypothetical protein